MLISHAAFDLGTKATYSFGRESVPGSARADTAEDEDEHDTQLPEPPTATETTVAEATSPTVSTPEVEHTVKLEE